MIGLSYIEMKLSINRIASFMLLSSKHHLAAVCIIALSASIARAEDEGGSYITSSPPQTSSFHPKLLTTMTILTTLNLSGNVVSFGSKYTVSRTLNMHNSTVFMG